MPGNPYWYDLRPYWDWLKPKHRPRFNAHAFLYASMFERRRFDVHGAHCVKDMVINTVNLHWRGWLKVSINNLLVKQKEQKHEKAVSIECSSDAASTCGDTAGSAGQSAV
jgi:hypothetical protein